MKKILIALLLAHFLVSVVFNAFLSCDSFLSFYGKSKDGLLHRTLDAVTHWKPVYALAKYTGAETGFGFFSPNVLTSSVILDGLAFLIDHLPVSWHIVLAGRNEPRLPLARWP